MLPGIPQSRSHTLEKLVMTRQPATVPRAGIVPRNLNDLLRRNTTIIGHVADGKLNPIGYWSWITG